jgi:hypothetical protein
MKSNFMKVAFAIAVVMLGGTNVYNAQKCETLSDVALVNVEALADDEVIVDFPCTIQKDETCSFIGRLADGSKGNIDIEGAKNI